MQEAALSPLLAWANFYVIIGSAAAALTGLMFVVITLMASIRARRSNASVAAFGTPTVVHFCATLFIAATLTAPWQVLWNVSLLLGISGLAGVAYTAMVIQRARSQTDYIPVLEDWLWHMIFPLVSYTALVVAAIVFLSNPTLALFIVGAVTILFLFIGIHNAWDTVTYVSIKHYQSENKSQD